MKIAIITVNYNGKNNTLELLESLSKLQTTSFELLTIVVDNASSDGSVEAIKKQSASWRTQVDIVQTGQNLGFGLGYNKGLECAKIWGADYFLLINNDSKIEDSQTLQKLLKVFKTNPKAGMVAPKILFEKGFEFHKDRYTQKDLGKVIWYGGGFFDWDNIASIHRGIDEVDLGQYDMTDEVTFISGACFLIKKEVLEKVKGFGGDYFLYFEDAEICKRVIDAGFKLYYTGETFIYHKVSQSTGVGSALTDYYHTRNRLIFGMEYGRLRTRLALLREAVKHLIFGRMAQKRGIIDYFSNRFGKNNLFHQKDDSPTYPFKLSIGIVNYNTADLTKKLLESIFSKDSGFNPDDMEIIVLDNGKLDPAYPKIKEFLGKIKYLKNEENEGFSKGYNKTIKYSLGEYYLMLNSDIEILKDSLSETLKWAQNYQNAILGGKLVFPDYSDQDSVYHLPTIGGAFKEYFLGKNGSYFMYMPKGEEPKKVEGLVMACFLIPRVVFEKIGLLDESTFIFFEDIEYCRRAKKFNIPLYFIPSAKFIHHHGASTKKIGLDKATSLLQKSAKNYHGAFYYFVLTWVLRIGQKLGKTQTPVSRWVKSSK